MFERLAHLFQRLREYNVLEILVEFGLIWVMMYMILRFLRGTRGARVLKGFGLVLILVGVMVASIGGGFARLEYLLGNFLTLAAFVLVIVFQPELRRGLMRIGGANFFRGGNISAAHVIEELLDAVDYLSKRKVGAVIAFERDVGLEGITEVGTRLNADVSSALLKTIFWHDSALHDMGVVIRGEKILAAGVQFPLAEGVDISADLGSRHRAAVGLSEESDALVVIVSEETGTISLAENGQLLRKLSVDTLRAVLRKGLMIDEVEVEEDEEPEVEASASTPVSVKKEPEGVT